MDSELWLFTVLNDLSKFAESEQMQATLEMLLDTIFVATVELEQNYPATSS